MELRGACSSPGTLRIAGKLLFQGKAGAGHIFPSYPSEGTRLLLPWSFPWSLPDCEVIPSCYLSNVVACTLLQGPQKSNIHVVFFKTDLGTENVAQAAECWLCVAKTLGSIPITPNPGYPTDYPSHSKG